MGAKNSQLSNKFLLRFSRQNDNESKLDNNVTCDHLYVQINLVRKLFFPVKYKVLFLADLTKGHVSFSHHFWSVVVVVRRSSVDTFQKSSPLKSLNGFA